MKNKILSNWEKVVDSGFSDKHNMCIWSMITYKGFLYVGTLNFTNGCKVYRSKTGDKDDWEKVSETGFDKSCRCEGARTMLVYNDLLWIVTYSRLHGSQVWVTNGEYSAKKGILIWKKANVNGFGQGEKIPGSRAMVVYKNKLHVGTQYRGEVPRIYRYDGEINLDKLEPEKWTWINKDWQEDEYNIAAFSLIGDMLNFKTPDGKEYVYTSIYSEVAHLVGQFKRTPNFKIIKEIIKFFLKMRCSIWRYNGEKWEMVSKPGFGKKNIMAMASLAFKDSIYFGTTKILGGEIWQSKDGLNWERVMKRGFSYPFNLSVWELHVFKDRLVVGMQNQWIGCQIWVSKQDRPTKNKDFTKISKTGMTKRLQINPFKLKQDGIKTMETFNGKLYAGTASYMNILNSGTIIGPGCEIWRINEV
jgi:hypothetical protein